MNFKSFLSEKSKMATAGQPRASNNEALMKDVTKNLRSLLLSNKHGVPIQKINSKFLKDRFLLVILAEIVMRPFLTQVYLEKALWLS